MKCPSCKIELKVFSKLKENTNRKQIMYEDCCGMAQVERIEKLEEGIDFILFNLTVNRNKE